MCRRVFRYSAITQAPPHVILNWLQNPLRRSRNVILCPYLVFQDLLIITISFTLKSACKWYLYLIKTHCGQRFFQFHQELIYQ